jgi:DNA-binding response OmpR family regulator
MVVDDDKRYLELLEFLLDSAGYETIPVQYPLQVQQTARETQPEVIILDVAMPELDGIAVGMNLKSDIKTASIPVIYVSALSHNAEKRDGMIAGAACYLTKPFAPAELLSAIEKVLTDNSLEGARS